jgi:hypothetical protein
MDADESKDGLKSGAYFLTPFLLSARAKTRKKPAAAS